MSSNIQYIQIMDKNHVEICVECPICLNENTHIITSSCKPVKDTTVIDFTQLGSRACHHCLGQYSLYCIQKP